jgi:F-type H+-transporting ATPase subunit gamma
MANLKEIRGRISSIKNTRKITAAMSRIAAARLRKAQQAVEAARPYGRRMAEVVGGLVSELAGAEKLPDLLVVRPVEKVAVIVVSADRGLCGAFNTNVNRLSERKIRSLLEADKKVELLAVGRKAATYLRHRGFVASERFAAPDSATILDIAAQVAKAAIDLYAEKKVDQVLLIYNKFENVISQVPTELVLLPVQPLEGSSAGPRDRVYEPGREVILERLLPAAVETAIAQALFNSVASEIAARRSAMDSATDNASQIIADLTLIYNRERQAAITKELMEIIGGAEALKG